MGLGGRRAMGCEGGARVNQGEGGGGTADGRRGVKRGSEHRERGADREERRLHAVDRVDVRTRRPAEVRLTCIDPYRVGARERLGEEGVERRAREGVEALELARRLCAVA